MKATSIKKYLRPSTIMGRKSTFANAFASALAPFDAYDQEAVFKAIRDLGQDPDGDLKCVYCDADAATWDHIFNRVVKGEFSGHGHRIRNLVPCCRTCNESKGQKSWQDFLEIRNPPDKVERAWRLTEFLRDNDIKAMGTAAMRHEATDEMKRFIEIRTQIFELMAEADQLAADIRDKAKG
ncbi:HNH endonuclease [Paracoccus sp. PAR01]|uniref:HNH endonuclease n=1 Tax=Paracoccus sp. PAR01 TaxID=2769282 RepID=UPI0017831DF3|nr:HNH endonuclease [Paracoccus sp. PAR01]MBD9529808.1 HNH endonuclease [Paracoccus sp. PAR01]